MGQVIQFPTKPRLVSSLKTPVKCVRPASAESLEQARIAREIEKGICPEFLRNLSSAVGAHMPDHEPEPPAAA